MRPQATESGMRALFKNFVDGGNRFDLDCLNSIFCFNTLCVGNFRLDENFNLF